PNFSMIRYNPTGRPRGRGHTPHRAPRRAPEELSTTFPWYEPATGRLEIYHRVLLWRALTGDDSFDLDHWVTRVSNHPREDAV
ncbi:phytanoyl-CoA dioxygenase, partial [Streptomyces mirabilis]